MAADDSISLRGAAEVEKLKPGHTSAVLLKLDDGIVQELKRAAREKDVLRFTTGSSPRIRIGGNNVDLTITSEAFRTELYACTAAHSRDFNFAGVISHRAELKTATRSSKEETSGSDAALAALQSSLASYEQERQANQTTITSAVLPAPNSRFEAARKEKSLKRNNVLGSRPESPSLNAVGTPRLGAGPTSAPASEDEVKMQAMKKSLIHLLAIGPITSEDVERKTNIPRDDLEPILKKYGKQVDGKWELADRACRDLEVWRFKYPTPADRKSAIDTAVKAYDRMRLGKDEKLWQMLLPERERGQGKILSRLHLGGQAQVNRGLTPSYQPSPIPHLDDANESKVASAANTPRLGALTPRPGSSQGDVMKRLLSKDPKKARAAIDAKEKKRKEREAAASDREGARPAKKQATQQANVKSAEFVHSSEEEDSSDGKARTSQPKPNREGVKAKPKASERPLTGSSTSPDSSDTPLKADMARKGTAKTKASAAASKKTAPPTVKAKPLPAGKATPQTNSNNLAAPSSQHKTQRSPQKQDSKPTVPSPLGAARPRVASDVSDRNAVGVQRLKQGGGETPKGLGITNGAGKSKERIANADAAVPKSTGTPKAAPTNGVQHKGENGLKRKAEHSPSHEDIDNAAIKHRKTDSGSSHSQKQRSESSRANGSEISRTSPDGLIDSGSSDSAGYVAVTNTITYSQGVKIAEKFRDDYYPAYAKLYDDQAARRGRGEKVSEEETGRLLQMHARLEQMKKEITAASKREHGDE